MHSSYFRATTSSESHTLSYTTLFRSGDERGTRRADRDAVRDLQLPAHGVCRVVRRHAEHPARPGGRPGTRHRKSTCLNSSHANISYAVFCLKKKDPHHRHLLTRTSDR